ncbi:MAG: hypothetical protein FJZ62_04465 [Chlamydiae bacterium]|nr:hypothetical protein [Chlamydiota bacterium]
MVYLLRIAIALAVITGAYSVATYIYQKQELKSYENFFLEEEKIALDVMKPKWDEANPQPNQNQDRIKVLVIEGGGAKGLYALRVLNYLEKKTGKPISELYDVMGGTSIGSLLVSLLSVPNNEGKAKYSAQEVLDVFGKVAQKTLEPNWKQKALSGFGLLSPLLNNIKFIQELKKVYGNMLFSEALNHLVLYGYNFNTTKIIGFHNRGKNLESADPVLYQLIGGSTAPFGISAPNKILFSPFYSSQFIGDAALVINNPLSPIMVDLLKMYPGKKFLVTYIVIGPKELEDTINFPFYSGWIKASGMFKQLMITAQNQLIRESMDSLSAIYKFDFLLEIGLYQNMEWAKMNSFDFSQKNLKKIDEFSKLTLSLNKVALDRVAEELVKD